VPLLGAANAADAVEGQCGEAQPVVLRVELKRVIAGGERLRALPIHALEVEQIPGKSRRTLHDVETVTATRRWY
jgi:hypothetical protein